MSSSSPLRRRSSPLVAVLVLVLGVLLALAWWILGAGTGPAGIAPEPELAATEAGGTELPFADAEQPAERASAAPAPEEDISPEDAGPEDDLQALIDRAMALAGRTLRVQGHVTSAATGEPLAGARVGVEGLGHTDTDGLGWYELTGLPLGVRSLRIGAALAGYSPSFRSVGQDTEGPDVQLDFVLEAGLVLRGRAVGPSGEGLPGVRVLAVGRQRVETFTAEPLQRSLTTDAGGWFEIDAAHPTSHWALEARGPDESLARGHAGPFDVDSGVVDIGELVLESAGSVVGRVELGAPPLVDAARVELRVLQPPRDAGRGGLADSWSSATDSSGRFAFEAVVPGEYLLELLAPEDRERTPLAVRSVHVAPGLATEVNLVADGARLRGKLLDDAGEPARGGAFRLQVLDSRGRVVAEQHGASDGEFELALPEAEDLTLLVHDAALRFRDERVEGLHAGVPDLVVRLQRRVGGLSLAGSVRLADGTPAGDAYVALRDVRTGELVPRVGIPDAEGAFSIADLDDTEYVVELVDFKGLYDPLPALRAHPSGGALELVLEPRP